MDIAAAPSPIPHGKLKASDLLASSEKMPPPEKTPSRMKARRSPSVEIIKEPRREKHVGGRYREVGSSDIPSGSDYVSTKSSSC